MTSRTNLFRHRRRSVGRLVVGATAVAALTAVPAAGVARAQVPGDFVQQDADEGALSIQPGDSGELVAWWQDRINTWIRLSGTSTAPLTVDGIYGERSQWVTLNFQQSTDGVPVDGVIDPEDRVALHNEIDALQSDPGAPPIERGDRNELAAWWQDRLNTWIALSGSSIDQLVVDGWYGPNTEEATMAFQETVDDVPADGVVNPEDRVALANRIDALQSDPGAPPIERGDRNELAAWWQDRLNTWIALSGSSIDQLVVDGWYGPNTEAATIEFQEATEAVPTDGIVDPEDRVALREAIDDLAGGTDGDTAPPVSGMTRCSNPEGFSIAYPSDWSVNDGDVVGPCSQFDPEPFEVTPGDERVAAITAYVDPVAFQTAIPPSDDVVSRATTEVGGHQAVRLETVAGSDSLYPEGTAATFYMVDLTDSVGAEGETLILDVIDLTFVDYAAAVSVLDQMFDTLELAETTGDESVVASYHGASTSITVRAEPGEQELCLTWQEADLNECVGIPEDGSVTAAGLGNDLSPLIVGAAAPDVFRVVAVEEGVHRTAFLPTSIPGTDVRGWAIPGTLSDLDFIETYAASGDPLGSIAVDDTGTPAPTP